MTVDIGTGATLTASSSGFSIPILSIEVSDVSRESIETSHLGSTVARSYIPGDLYDPGTIDLECLHDTDNVLTVGRPPISATMSGGTATEGWTITFPVPSGMSNGAKAYGKGFVTSWGWSIPLEDRVTSTITIKMTGAWTFTDAS